MKLEAELHSLRPALDRAIAEADDRASTAGVSLSHDRARSRVLIVAFAVVALVAGTVGLVAQLDSGGGTGTAPLGTTPHVTASTTPPSSAEATTTSAPTTTTSALPDLPLTLVRWDSVTYPITAECGTTFSPPVVVRQVDYAAPAPDVQLAVVMVRCNAGAGTPPDAIYFYDGATPSGVPHFAGTLMRVSDGWQAEASFSIEGTNVNLHVRGFSSDSVPNCCPDVPATLNWDWTGTTYEQYGTVPPHVPGPAFGGY
jgi:hypothetical protein